MSNIYFKKALHKATTIFGNRKRLLALVTHMASKVKSSQLSKDWFTDQLFLVGRLLKAYAQGTYRNIPTQSILLLIAAIIYFINPFDLIPDAIIGIGLTDDITVLTGVYKLVSAELTKFRQWEVGNLRFD